jgi:hypothetical protein
VIYPNPRPGMGQTCNFSWIQPDFFISITWSIMSSKPRIPSEDILAQKVRANIRFCLIMCTAHLLMFMSSGIKLYLTLLWKLVSVSALVLLLPLYCLRVSPRTSYSWTSV